MSDINFAFNQKEINEFIDKADKSHDVLISIFATKYPNQTPTYLFLAAQLVDPKTDEPLTTVSVKLGCPNPPGWGKGGQPTVSHTRLENLPKFIILATDKEKMIDTGATDDTLLFASVIPFVDAEGYQQVKLSFTEIGFDATLL